MADDLFRIPPDLTIGPAYQFLPLAGEVNWGMDKFGVSLLRDKFDGSGVTVGVIDTGIDETHPMFAGKLVAARDFTGSPYGARDRHGHGTHCSGTAAGADPRIGVATGAKIVFGKGLSDSGSGSGTAIANAMRYCFEQGARVLSMSLGSSGPDPTINAAGAELAAKGCWIAAAAGNSGGNTADVDFPGRFPWALSVAALASDLTPASFTNRGAKIDTSGPGVGIWSARPGGGFQQMSGTSMATPFVAGVLALVMSGLLKRGRPVPTAEELRAELAKRSTDTFTPGDDLRTGPGWITPVLFALRLGDDLPPPVAG